METENETIVSPELLGPIFKTENITLRQALYNDNINRRVSLLATFVPDELILLIDEQAKSIEYDFVILLLIDISDLYSLFDEICNCRNNGSSGVLQIFNLYTSTIVEQICCNGGDVLKFSDSGILSLWKQEENESISEAMQRVISFSFALKEALRNLGADYFDISKVSVKMAISAGSISFSAIGSGEVRHYAVGGEPVTAVAEAARYAKSTDLVIAESALELCVANECVYVIQDENHYKVTKDLKSQRSVRVGNIAKNVELICEPAVREQIPESMMQKNRCFREISKAIAALKKPRLDMWKSRKCLAIVRNREIERQIMENRHRILDSCKNQIGVTLKSFIIIPPLKQIEHDRPLEHLTEMKNVTVVMIEVLAAKDAELITLADYCHAIILKACEHVGWLEGVSLGGASAVFRIVFGLRSYLKSANHCRFGVACADKLLAALGRAEQVDGINVGVSTGIVCCTVTGHAARQHYALIGPPITKAENIMLISSNKVMCDLDTLLYSEFKRIRFLYSGLVNLKRYEKEYVFVYSNKDEAEEEITSDLRNAYPILGRFEELELFSNILDDIGLIDRSYAGIIIEGGYRSGKSRVLDAFAASAKGRQIEIITFALHAPFAVKLYAVIHKILEQILDTRDCATIVERERNIMKKLGHAIPPQDLCYLNTILRVQFQLSEQYTVDSDWKRHHKTIGIFEKILKQHNRKMCILLDDVQHMDYMSWLFLAHALNNENVIIAMTILEMQSWEELSRVEIDIYKDERLWRRALPGLESGLLPTLVCQFLDVQAISTELHDFMMNLEMNSPGWFELFLSLILECGGFDIVTVSPSQAAAYNLIFPDSLLSTRISADLFPEEVAPSEPWNRKNVVSICQTNENFQIADSFKTSNINTLSLEIFSKLSPYEQEVVKCATVLGRVFERSMLEMIIPNHESLKMSEAIESLMLARIIECGSLQRRHARVGDLEVCSVEPRITFSDMHHLLRCRCHSRHVPETEQHLPEYAHCRLMEFKVPIFQREVYKQMPEPERKLLHRQLVDICKKDARKCAPCGGGSFLNVPGKDKPKRTEKAPPATASTGSSEARIETPTPLDDSQNSSLDLRGISIVRTSSEIDDSHEPFGPCFQADRQVRSRNIFGKSRVHPAAWAEVDLNSLLRHFGHVDFRNCRCLDIIDCVFSQIQEHLDHIDDYKKVINLTLEYAAALVEHGQPAYALRFLAKADEKNDYVSTYGDWKNPALHRKMIKKSMILCLRGNAYVLLGNYPQAKSNYLEALSLYKTNFTTNELLTCCRTTSEKIKQNIRWTFTHPAVNASHTKHEQKMILIRQNAASCLRLVSEILMINNRPKLAKLASVQSIAFGFSNYESNNFYNQCQLYLSFVKLHGQLGNLSFISQAEKYILFAIHKKQEWCNSEDVVILMHVYASIFRVSWLRGQLGRAVHFGEKALSIAKTFQVVRLKYELLTSLIQILIRLKRVGETMEMLQQLRDYGSEDSDRSVLSWYYALCMDLLLDSGLLVESYESCASHARKVLAGKPDHCVARDSRGLKRLLAGLWSWQLRKGDLTSTVFVQSLDYFTVDLAIDDCSQIVTLCKILECHLLLLTRCVSMKQGSQMDLLLQDIDSLVASLDEIAKMTEFVKPHYHLLKAYFCLLRSRASLADAHLRRAARSAAAQMNLMTLAWIIRSRNTWKAVSYNNMARYWEENIGYRNAIAWQDVDTFDLNDWSNVLYSLPAPESYI